MDHNDRELRDAAGVGPYAGEREHLVPLSSLEAWAVTKGEPDIRGWEVRTVSGRQLGAVNDLLIDKQAGEVVLLDVDLPGADGHTFVPIRVVQIDRTRRLVLMDSADLPEAVGDAADTRIAERRAGDSGLVRYPRSDREVVVERQALADNGAPPDTNEVSAERRRAERRRIDRMSTDL